MSFLSTLFGGGAEKEAAARNRGLLDQYKSGSLGALDSGLSNATGALNNAASAYAPLAGLGTKYGGASTMLLDALGVNGAAGTANAQSAFQAQPGYQFQVDQATDAINRRRAMSGMWDSGNTDIDLAKTVTGLADQSYNSWLSSLGQFINPELSATGGAASGIAGVNTSLANLYSQDAQNRVGVYGNTTSGGMSANNQEAAGKAAGAKNMLSAGMSLASLGAGMGGGFGFGAGSSPVSAYNWGGVSVPVFGK